MLHGTKLYYTARQEGEKSVRFLAKMFFQKSKSEECNQHTKGATARYQSYNFSHLR